MLPTIIHRTPLRRRAELDIDRLFHGLFNVDGSTCCAVAADLYETEDGYGIELDVPGLTEADIEVTMDRGVLTITGTRSEEEGEDNEGRTYHVRERRSERFTRSFTLPASIRGDNVEAHLDAGVLTVELPKSPEAKPHKIAVARAK